MQISLFRDRDLRLVPGSVGLSAMGDLAYASMFSAWTVGMALGALASVGLLAATIQGASLALPALWLSFAFYLVCSLVGGTANGQERDVPEPRPHPRARPAARPCLRRVQRNPQHRRARRLRRRRPLGRGDRPPWHACLRWRAVCPSGHHRPPCTGPVKANRPGNRNRLSKPKNEMGERWPTR
jgi:hypothetical protein